MAGVGVCEIVRCASATPRPLRRHRGQPLPARAPDHARRDCGHRRCSEGEGDTWCAAAARAGYVCVCWCCVNMVNALPDIISVDDGTGVLDCTSFHAYVTGGARRGVPSSFRLGSAVRVLGRLRVPPPGFAVSECFAPLHMGCICAAAAI